MNYQEFQIQTEFEIEEIALNEQYNEVDDNEAEGEEVQDQSLPSYSEVFKSNAHSLSLKYDLYNALYLTVLIFYCYVAVVFF